MTAPEQMMAALRAELERQCSIGAGEFSVCPETGLWQVSADLDIDSLLLSLSTRPATDELVEALRHALTFIENRFSDLSPEKRSTVEHIRTALRNAGAAS